MISRPEANEKRFAFVLTPTMKQQIEEYAKKNGVTQSNAVKYIINLFFDEGFGQTKEDNPCKQSEPES